MAGRAGTYDEPRPYWTRLHYSKLALNDPDQWLSGKRMSFTKLEHWLDKSPAWCILQLIRRGQ
ncbi:hypothetical protein GJ744_008344 [Endocarpon pusillum]|uniref:Uncharacterized protein n=1 Tax=Endocarpon pusillum TaxID=364733 RepID=A0A8H7AJJ3_9EURO|nr:hypothetical protein GJ744_008344 [Endocarpon pusillum]